jgi:hypothetical protein
MQPISSPILRHVGYVVLPEHSASGGFDHAAVHAASGHVYVAHTANDPVDVFDPASQRHLYSIPQLRGVAGVLVRDEAQLIVSSTGARTRLASFHLVGTRRCQRQEALSRLKEMGAAA